MAMTAGTVLISRVGLDEIQQHLFAIALGLRSLQTSAADESVARELERIEMEVDALIREVRCHASARSS
jgi:hypothetical protein